MSFWLGLQTEKWVFNELLNFLPLTLIYDYRVCVFLRVSFRFDVDYKVGDATVWQDGMKYPKY